jgi:hypothetical protein
MRLIDSVIFSIVLDALIKKRKIQIQLSIPKPTILKLKSLEQLIQDKRDVEVDIQVYDKYVANYKQYEHKVSISLYTYIDNRGIKVYI